MRRSRSVLDALSTAAVAAFSHDSVLVPTSSITLYTLSGIACSSRRDHIPVAAAREVRLRGDPEIHAAVHLHHEAGPKGHVAGKGNPQGHLAVLLRGRQDRRPRLERLRQEHVAQ